jgi:large-conductance mechanosensitive channel
MNDTDNIAPSLVSKKTIKKLEKIFLKAPILNPTWEENILFFYNDYIKPNLFALIVFFIIGIFLTIKYLLKLEKKERKKKRIKKSLLKKILKDYENKSHLESKSKSNEYDEDLYYRASDESSFDLTNNNDDIENRDPDEISFYSISKEHERLLKESDGLLPVGILNDAFEQKKSKMTFDELAKLVSGR